MIELTDVIRSHFEERCGGPPPHKHSFPAIKSINHVMYMSTNTPEVQMLCSSETKKHCKGEFVSIDFVSGL